MVLTMMSLAFAASASKKRQLRIAPIGKTLGR